MGLGLCPVGCSSPPPPATSPSLRLESCRVAGLGRLAACGRWQVPENYDEPRGKTLDLKVIVVPATQRNALPDPIYLLAGGPGQAATEVFPAMIAQLGELNAQRDFVLVDIRGTGQSNAFDCDDAKTDTTGQVEDFSKIDVEALEDCVAQLEVDPRNFSTRNVVRDLQAVRKALGHGPINLFGASYGTRLALEYARHHPKAIRSMILDGVVPPEMALPEGFAADAESAFAAMIERCQAKASCAAAFPDIRGDLDTLVQRFADGPIEITIDHPRTGQPQTYAVGRQGLLMALRGSFYSPELTALLPLALHRGARGELRHALGQFMVFAESMSSSMNPGMLASVVCSEDLPRIDAARHSEASRASFLGSAAYDTFATMCAHWPSTRAPEYAGQPVHSDIPTLLLSGRLDPVTPPRWAKLALQSLSRGHHIVVDAAAHGTLTRGCMPELAAQFVEQLDAAQLDTSCIEDIPMPDFFIDFAGPAQK